MIRPVDSLSWALGVGIGAGVIAAGIWASWQSVRIRWRRRWLVGLEGIYQARWKLTDKILPGTISITVSGNVLELTSSDDFGAGYVRGGGAPFTGWIVMSDEPRGSGRGHYEQTLKDDEIVWGFFEIQVREDGSMLVHRTYAHPVKKAAIVSGFVWSRI
jgi:hypothetical protein